jgi:hypothetical protein
MDSTKAVKTMPKEDKADNEVRATIASERGLIGALSNYIIGEDFQHYIELATMYFNLNRIVEDQEKVQLFLIHLGEASSKLMAAIRPKTYSEIQYDELIQEAKKIFIPVKDEITARYNLMKRRQKSHESASDYAIELRDLAKDCEFKECCRETCLRDYFIFGVSSEEATAKLLSARPKNLTEAANEMSKYEAIRANAKHMKDEKDGDVNAIGKSNKKRGVRCYKCNGKGHYASMCPNSSSEEEEEENKKYKNKQATLHKTSNKKTTKDVNHVDEDELDMWMGHLKMV